MIDSWRPGYPTDVKVMNYLNILTIDNIADRNNVVTYMADQTGREYILKLCKHVTKVYGDTYLTRWPMFEDPERRVTMLSTYEAS